MKTFWKIYLPIFFLWSISLFVQASPVYAATATFNYNGGVQTFVVPAGVTSVTFDVIAAGGSGGGNASGRGGRVQGTLTVTPGETLNLYVGNNTGTFPTDEKGGAGDPINAGGHGGGASSIRQGGTALANRVVVAGAGAGTGDGNYTGGNGGNTTGQTGTNVPGGASGGGGGTASAGGGGGAGGVAGTGGSLGSGGDGGFQTNEGGGGGGGGYYGGGGGGGTLNTGGGGGGGGSSFAGTGTSSIVHTQGYNASGNDGQIIITYSTAPTISSPTQASITATGATLGGNVTSDGGAAVTDRGACVGTSANPALGGTCFSTSGTTGVFTVAATGLTQGTLYHYRAYATNSVGTSYTTDDSFTTLVIPAAPTNLAATILSSNSKQVSLKWDSVSGATSYNIYRSSTNNSSGFTAVGTSTVTSGFINDIAQDLRYWFYVKAVGSGGEGSASNVVEVLSSSGTQTSSSSTSTSTSSTSTTTPTPTPTPEPVFIPTTVQVEDVTVPTQPTTAFESAPSATPTPTPEATASSQPQNPGFFENCFKQSQIIFNNLKNIVKETAINILGKVKLLTKIKVRSPISFE